MSKRKTDFRALRARRDAALASHALNVRDQRRPAAPDPAAIAMAITAGRFTRLPEKGRRR